VDPRLLDSMGITPSNVPGYTLSNNERRELEELRRLRQDKASVELASKNAKEAAAISAAIEALQEEEAGTHQSPKNK
ncbi:MAG: hypothetical protein AAGC73_10405, partial [Verrucomicrobiota bacterium]